MPIEHINKTDTLNEGREKLNEAIDGANAADVTSKAADTKATQALANSESTQTQLDTIVVVGDSSVEAAQARVDEKGVPHTTLKARIDDGMNSVNQQLAETDDHRRFESMVNRKEPGLLATWIDDDGNHLVYPRLKPILEDYGIPITSALITNRMEVSDRITPEQRDELSSLGMEFISHTHYHDVNKKPIDMTEEELDYDFRTSKKVMRDHGYNYSGLVLPFAGNSDLIQKVARRYFDYVVGTGSGKQGYPQYPGELDNYYIWRVTVEQGFDFVKEQLDEAAERGVGWVVFVSHIYTEWYSDAYVRQVIDYAISKGFEFVTAQEGIDRMGNTAQFGSNKITADGKFIGGLTVQKENDNILIDTPITDFNKNTVTHSRITVPQSVGFPGETSGIAMTYRYEQDVYSFQEFVTTRHKKYHVRYWDTDLSDWSDFVDIHERSYFRLDNNAITNQTPSSFFEVGVTIAYISNAGDTEGLPDNSSGTLITYKLGDSSGRTYQEFKKYNSIDKYIRYENDVGNWSEWHNPHTHEIETNTISSLTPSSEFKLGLSIAYVSGEGNREGLPDNSSGMITTYKASGSGRTYQEFKKYNSFDKHIRYETSTGTWSEWRKFVLE